MKKLSFCLYNNKLLPFQFEDFDLSAPSQWLEVRDGSSREATLIDRFTGVKVDDVIISSSSSLHIHLETGRQGKGRGFNFTYQNGSYLFYLLFISQLWKRFTVE